MKEQAYTLPWLPVNDVHPVVCFLCNGANPTAVAYSFTINERLFEVMHCEKDDLLFLSSQPGESYANALYNHPSYFSEPNDAYGHFVDAAAGAKTGAFRLQELTERGFSPASFLEIGSGLGFTLEAFATAGITAQGIEFSSSSVEASRSRGLSVEQGTLDDPVPQAARSNGPFEVVAMYSVLEHVPHPPSFLEQVTSALSPEGLLVVRVPRMSKNGPWISLLDHYWHFTEASIQLFLTRQGYTIKEMYPSGSFIASNGDKLESITVLATHQ